MESTCKAKWKGNSMILGRTKTRLKGSAFPCWILSWKGWDLCKWKPDGWKDREGKQRDCALSGCSVALLASLQHMSPIKFGDPRSSGSMSEQKHAYSAPDKRTHRYQQENLMGIPRNCSFWRTLLFKQLISGILQSLWQGTCCLPDPPHEPAAGGRLHQILHLDVRALPSAQSR